MTHEKQASIDTPYGTSSDGTFRSNSNGAAGCESKTILPGSLTVSKRHAFFVALRGLPDTPYPNSIAGLIADYAVNEADETFLSVLREITASIQTFFNTIDIFNLPDAAQRLSLRRDTHLHHYQGPSRKEPPGVTYIMHQLTEALQNLCKNSYLASLKDIVFVSPATLQPTSYFESLEEILFASPATRQALEHPVSPSLKIDIIEMIRAFKFLAEYDFTLYSGISLNCVKLYALKKHLDSCQMALEFREFFNCFFEKVWPLLQSSPMALVEEGFDLARLQNLYHNFVCDQYKERAKDTLQVSPNSYQSLLIKTFEESHDFLYHFAIIDYVHEYIGDRFSRVTDEVSAFLLTQAKKANNRVAFVWLMSGGVTDRAYKMLFPKLSLKDFILSLSFSFKLGFELSNSWIGHYMSSALNYYLYNTTVNHIAFVALIERYFELNRNNMAFLWAITRLLETILFNCPRDLHHYDPVKQSLITAMSKINAATDPRHKPQTEAMYAALVSPYHGMDSEIRAVREDFLRDIEALFEKGHPEEKTTARP